MTEPLKQCTKCKEFKPIFEFSKRREKQDGLRSECKSCQHQYIIGYFARPEVRYRMKLYRQRADIKDKKKQWQRVHQVKKPLKLTLSPEEKRRKKNAYMREYNRRPDVKQHMREWRQQNAQCLLEYRHEYSCRPEARKRKRELDIIRRAARADTPGTLIMEQFHMMCQLVDGKCLACGKETKLTVDHIIPVSCGGCSCIHNIQPLCISCNSSKNKNHITDYRSQVILDWLSTIPHEH